MRKSTVAKIVLLPLTVPLFLLAVVVYVLELLREIIVLRLRRKP